MSVRARLTAGVAILLIAVFAAMGVVLARETESTMINRVDQDVKAESERWTKPSKDKDEKGGPDDQGSNQARSSPTPDSTPQASDSTSEYGDTKRSFCTRIYAANGTIQQQWLSGYGDDPDPPPDLPPFGSEEFNEIVGEIVTRESEDGSLDYRVLIQPGRFTGDMVVTAAPLREVHEAVSQVLRRFVAIGFAG